MAYLISYRKASDQYTDYILAAPEGSTELCTIDGVTYVSIPDGQVLPSQPEQISSSVSEVTLTDELRADIHNASIHIAVISKRVAEQISQRYSVTDEIKLLRTAPSEEFDIYNEYAESCRAWGRAEKAKLGL
ncbi:MAG: hypothetical protein PHN76_06090 [Advenella sp.]|uniref:hypothetical protein n=1 Tax=Advenella sp. TaxID=1872388 RepID=UPI002588F6B7|nr:hypothetical protein [Advenella sp.]MDD3757717.1 hypothetical protein [Advenella sp.]